ncbi:hypothetical protein GGR56DRAFT_679687 [Xylariaceae sp. FL0804]|nr:hypothetical protein GGR56DRAFT_679687 [Xylariaceae sp. FL0804]
MHFITCVGNNIPASNSILLTGTNNYSPRVSPAPYGRPVANTRNKKRAVPTSQTSNVPVLSAMAPLTPHWAQPSHPDVQEVVYAAAGSEAGEFASRSLSRVALPPFGVFAKLGRPPCAPAAAPTYATVQRGRDRHLHLNSDLVYINHSCEPSLIFDMSSLNILAGPNGLQAGEELTFFYPSTEWSMDQPFDCLCGHATCRGRIAGARDMSPAGLEGMWLNAHVREMLEERQQQQEQQEQKDPSSVGLTRRGATSRELSGEMGGDTKSTDA